jgi:hypothetical protein
VAARWAWRRGRPDLRCRAAAISGWFRGGGERNLGGDREEEESRRRLRQGPVEREEEKVEAMQPLGPRTL